VTPALETLLAELVQAPSINPMGRTDIAPELCGESRVTAIYERELQALGVKHRRSSAAPGRDNLYAFFESTILHAPTILLEAHLDTVPVDGMTIDPFCGTINEGKLYGRGSCDVKAGGVAMFEAFRKLVQQKPANAPNVILAYTVDEEHTFLGAQQLVKDIRADFAIVAEPTNLQIVRSHKGVARWSIETTGTACHSSTPSKGVSAIYRMAQLITVVERYAAELEQRTPHPQLGPATISIGTIVGGVSPNTVPDACRVSVDRRLLPGETSRQVMDDLSVELRKHTDVPFEFHPTLACPALTPTGGEPFVQHLADVIGDPSLLAVPFGTDASTIQEAGIPAVVFGPGQIAQAHTKDEYVELTQVHRAADLLFEFLCTITKLPNHVESATRL
jgi:acetylornithine deacetylase/succinyl-diaminopimelate desuccinylase-like protein